ncbi:MAG: hypothetical protein AAB851_04085 [Patescibacteria group bacterium]
MNSKKKSKARVQLEKMVKTLNKYHLVKDYTTLCRNCYDDSDMYCFDCKLIGKKFFALKKAVDKFSKELDKKEEG